MFSTILSTLSAAPTVAFIGPLGPGELILIMLIVLIIFGAGKLPQIGEALGKGIKNFKKAATGKEDVDITPKKQLPEKSGDVEVLETEPQKVAKEHE